MGILGLGRKKKAVEEVAPEPVVVKQRSGPALMVLVPEVAGGTSFRAFPFNDTQEAAAYLATMIPAAVPRVHAFWAMMEKPGEVSNGGEAMVLIRPETGGELVYVVSFVDIESALSFARFEVKRGMSLGQLMVYWAELVTIVVDEEGIHLTPESAPQPGDIPYVAPAVASAVETEATPRIAEQASEAPATEPIAAPPAPAEPPEREGGATTNWVRRAQPEEEIAVPEAPVEHEAVSEQPEEVPFSLNPDTSPGPVAQPEQPAPAPVEEPLEVSPPPAIEETEPEPVAIDLPQEPAPAAEGPASVEFPPDPDEAIPAWAEKQIEEREPVATEEAQEPEFAPEPEIAVEVAPEPDDVIAPPADAPPEEPEPVLSEEPSEPETSSLPEVAVEPELQAEEAMPAWAHEPIQEPATVLLDEPQEALDEADHDPIEESNEPEPAPEPEIVVELAPEPPEEVQDSEPVAVAEVADVELPPEPELVVELTPEPPEEIQNSERGSVVEVQDAELAPEPELAPDPFEEIEDPEPVASDDVDEPKLTPEPEIFVELAPDPIEGIEDPEPSAADEVDQPEFSLNPQVVLDQAPAPVPEAEGPLSDAGEASTLPVAPEAVEDQEAENSESDEGEVIAGETPHAEIAFDDDQPLAAEAPGFLREDGRDEAVSEWPDEPLSPQAQYEIEPDEDDQVSDTPAGDAAIAEFELTLEEPESEFEPELESIAEATVEEDWATPEIPVEETVSVSSNGATGYGLHETAPDESDPPETIPGEEDLSPEMARFLKSRRRDAKDNPFKGFESPPGRF